MLTYATRVFLTGISFIFMAGCTSMPSILGETSSISEDAVNKAVSSEKWLKNNAITVSKTGAGRTISQPHEIPNNILDKEVVLYLPDGTRLADVIAALSYVKEMSVLVDSDKILQSEVNLLNFRGTVRDLFRALSSSHHISFGWQNGVITLSETSRYVVTVPQDEDLINRIEEEILGLGAVEISSSVSAGTISYRSTEENQKVLKKYINRIMDNSSLITLQIMVVNVNLEKDRREGFDWNSLQATLGNMRESVQPDQGVFNTGARLTGSGLSVGVQSGQVNLRGFFNLLSTYGKVQTTQDVSLKTLSGKNVSLISAQQIPYISNINLSTTDAGTSSSGLQTSTVQNGLEIDFTPYFEAESGLVTVDIKIDLDTLLGFVELSAGNQIGVITQPRTQKQSFNNTVRVQAGDTVLLGGVSYESLSDNRSTLSIIDHMNAASLNESMQSNSFFVLVRPTVVRYERIED